MPPGYCHVFDGIDGHDQPVSLVHEDTDAAAPDGGLRRRRQQRRPQGRPRARDDRRPPLRRRPRRHLPHRPQAAHGAVGLAGRAADRGGGRRRCARCAPRSAASSGPRWPATSPTCEIDGDRPPLRPAARARVAARARAGSGRRSRGRRSEDALPDRLPACVRGRPRRSRPCPFPGPAVAIHDTASGSPGRRPRPTARPGSTSAASRRTTPPTWATPRRTSPSTCSTGPGATPATRSPTSRTSPTSTTRCSSAPTKVERRLGGARRARDRAVPPGHGRAAGAAARRTTSVPSSRSRWSSTLIERLQEAGAVYRVDDDLYFSVTARPGLRRGVRAGPRRDAADLPRARRRPRPPGQEGPARLRRLARPSGRASRPGTARSAAAGPAGTSSAPRSRWSTSAPRSTCRAAAATWSSRTTRCAPATRRSPSPARRSPRPTRTPAWSAYDGEKMSKSKGNLVFVSALRNSDVDPMAIRLVLLRHHYRSDWEWTDDLLWDAVDTVGALAPGPRARRRRPGGPGRRGGPRGPRRRPRRPARARGRRPAGSPPRSAPTGSPTPATRTPR